MIQFIEKYAGASGIISLFISEGDPRPAAEQIHENYSHGGGWNPFEGFVFDYGDILIEKSTITYPEDPPLKAVAYARLREEVLILFEHSWLVIVQPDGTWQVSRLD